MNRRAFLRRAVGAGSALALGGTAAVRASVAVATAQPTPVVHQQPAGRDLVIMTAADITTLDPQESTAGADVRITLNLFDTLLTRTPDLALRPALAASWQSLDGRRWEFRLRDDARFHTGEPVTAHDVKFTIERAMSPTVGTAVATVFSTVEQVDAPDDHTVVITTLLPDSLLPARLSYFGGQILPARYLREVGPAAFAQAPVGSGVVRFVSWTPGQELVLAANADYWGGPPDFDRVIIRPRANPRDRVDALLAGGAHIATRLSPEWRLRLSRRPEARPVETLYAGQYAVAVNVRVPPLNDARIRQAMSLAVDRVSMLRGMWLGRGLIPNGFVAKGDHVGYAEEWAPLAYDQDRARGLLVEAGYAGEPIIFEATNGYLENDAATALVLKSMWEQVGLNVQVQGISVAARARKVHERSFRGVWLSDPTSTIQDPDGMMVRLIAPGGILDYWYDDEWLRLAYEARYAHDQRMRDTHYRSMQQIMLREMPLIPLLQPTEGYGVSAAIQWQPHPTDRMELRREVLQRGV